ncbi:mucin-2-like isoform X2 [Zeugodacus cucurbitae]|uniref:mucin-2-like isoform X2 n=1 Tax=Zeugodacus cucurbitae TaxID=28588 RepID=UPI0023D9091B|nr:mucin-2-like isoform X2 [Zeugodacus cucurbitae]
MLWNDLCYKLYFWPFLNYLAGIKGICPFYPVFTTTTTTTTTTTQTTVPTFSPTPPTVTTLPPCPVQPLVCLNGGVRPIPYCPCIDPRQSGLANTMGSTTVAPSVASRVGAASVEFQNTALPSDRLTFMPVNNAPSNVVSSLQPQPSSNPNFFNLPSGVRNGVQPSAAPSPVGLGSDTMVFSSLSGRRRRKRRKRNVHME